MKRLTTLILALAICLCTLAQAEFKAGAALRVITPDSFLPVSGGIGTPSPTTKIIGDLFARALVMENAGVRCAIVSVDNIGLPGPLCDKARAQIKGIAPEHVLIGATHTHSAPDAYGFPDREGNISADLEYLDFMCKSIADAVNEAIANLKPANLKITHEPIADHIAWNAYAEGLYDPRCSVLQAITPEGKPICTLVNFAIHPEVIGSDQGIMTADLCAPFYDRLEAKGGGMALFMNGAQGGMVTADNRIPNAGREERRSWEECVRIGELFAEEALRIIADAPVQENPPLHIAAQPLTFPVDSPLLLQIVKLSPLMKINDDNTVTTTLNLINVGTAQMINIPGEALPNIGAYLKRKMPTKHPFLFGLTNDAYGYILVKEDFEAFDRYAYISRTSLGERTGPILVDATLAFIAANPKPAE